MVQIMLATYTNQLYQSLTDFDEEVLDKAIDNIAEMLDFIQTGKKPEGVDLDEEHTN